MKPLSARLSRPIVPNRLERLGRDRTRYSASDFGMAHTKLRISGVAMAITPFCLRRTVFCITALKYRPKWLKTHAALWKKERIDNAQIFIGDAAEAVVEEEFYDLVFCLYFTPGQYQG